MADRTLVVTLVDGMNFESTGVDGVSVSLDSGPDTGGAGKGFRPMELLLVALGSCTAMDVVSILRKKRQNIAAYSVTVSGVAATEHPHVYTSIAIHHLLEGTNLSETAVEHAIQLSEEKYCSAHAMLSKAAAISTTFELRATPEAG